MDQVCVGSWCCYILKSTINNKTYIGSTNNTERRLRQHNGIICGGAKATKAMIPSEMYCIISGFVDHQAALCCEWLLKHPTSNISNISNIIANSQPAVKRNNMNKYWGVEGRINGLNLLISDTIAGSNNAKWTLKSKGSILNIWIKAEYCYLLLDEYPSNITINIFY